MVLNTQYLPTLAAVGEAETSRAAQLLLQQGELASYSDSNVGVPDRVELDENLGDSFYDILVRPSRIISIPHILLRWLPVIGPYRLSMVVAMRQIMYLRGIKSGLSMPSSIEVTFAELSAWAGIDEKSFRTHVDDPELAFFFRRVPNSSSMIYDTDLHQVRRAACRYQVNGQQPLPPGDWLAFKLRLSQWIEELGSLDAALDAALKLEPKDIFVYPLPAVPANWMTRFKSLSLRDAVLDLVVGGRLTSAQETKVAALNARLMPERRANIQIPWYRMRRWMPVLGQTRGWFTILCESRVFANAATGEVRNTARIPGGYQWFSDFLNIDERTVRRWFQPAQVSDSPLNRSLYPEGSVGNREFRKARERALDQERRADVAGYLTRFVTLEHETRKRNKVTELILRVADAEPLLPEHEDCLRAGVELGNRFLTMAPADQDALLQELQQDTQDLSQAQPGTVSRLGRLEPGTDSRFEPPQPGTVSRFKDPEPGTVSCLNLVRFPVLKGLELKDIGNQELFNFLTTTRTRQIKPVVVAAVPDLEGILTRTTHSTAKTGELLKKKVAPLAVVAYLLYAASPAGQKTTPGYLVKQLEAHPDHGPGWPYDRLADLSLPSLGAHIIAALQPFDHFGFVPHEDWDSAMQGTSAEKLKELAFRLGIYRSSRGNVD
jgi:hypothetical protein